MAVVLDTITPADNAENVAENYPVTVDLSDSTDMTLSLVEVLLGSKSHTVANGGLDHWSVKTEDSGSIVDDLTSVTFAVQTDWHTISGEEITVVVKYDSSTISTTTFVVTNDPFQGGTPVGYNTLEVSIPMSTSKAHYFVWNPGTDRCGAEVSYWVLGEMVAQANSYFYVGHIIRVSSPSSTVVGDGIDYDVDSSVVIQDIAGQKVPASSIVQGYFRRDAQASVITGIYFRHGEDVSAIVGDEVLAGFPASVVVYGTLMGTTLEVVVPDASTRTLLESLGVVFG